PYTNSPMHVGHGRTYITADIYARYYRMKGYNVLFPFAFQFTGTPVLAIAESIRRGDPDMIEFFKTVYGIPEEKVKELSDPYKLAEYFKGEMTDTAKKIGLSIDWRRSFTTIDNRFEKFVQWQLRKLKELGYLVTDEGIVGYCPHDNFPVGMHDTRGDIEPEIIQMSVIMFEGEQGYNFMVATSRPELIFGVVMLIINPESKYVVVEYRNKRFIISEKTYLKLSYQKEMKLVNDIAVHDILKLSAINPVTRKRIEVVPSKYVDPSLGTGVVMGYPAHDPFHYLALVESNKNLDVIPIIITEGLGEIPAEEIVVQTRDPAELKDFVESIYRTEYYKGYVREEVLSIVPDFLKQFVREKIVNKSVQEARRTTIELLKMLDSYDTIFEISNGPIYCRCGTEIVLKKVDKQWFITYDNPKWKSNTIKVLGNIDFVPKEMKREVEKIIFNTRREAISRSRGLGARLPWDESQIVESLSDSTLYTLLYTVIHKMNFMPNDEIFDYIFLGKGNPSSDIEGLRKEFMYWYPVDQRHTGRDLIQNHIPFYIYNHLAILGERYLPRRIVTNGFVRVGGRKMSKSLRNIYPLSKAIKEFGVDPVRVSLACNTDLSQDLDFNVNQVTSYAEQLKRLYDLISTLLSVKSGLKELRIPDKWLLSKLRSLISSLNQAMENFEIRKAANIILYDIYNALKDYFDMVEVPNDEVIYKVLSVWIRALSPFVPHTAEELWSKISDSFVSLEKYPTEQEVQSYPEALFEVNYLNQIVENVRELEDILGKKADRVIIYVDNSPRGKMLIKKVIEYIDKGIPMREFVSEVGQNEKASEKLYVTLSKLDKPIRDLIYSTNINEEEIIYRNMNYILKKLKVSEIVVYDSSQPDTPDIKGKKAQAIPLIPSVIVF
ncbi:leucine--tRNA ligase, partial [Sulfolobus sp. E5]